MKIKASLTVEAAFIMPFVMAVVIVLFLIMIYIYDYCILSDSVMLGITEYSFETGLSSAEIKQIIEDKATEHAGELLVIADNTSVDVSIDLLKVEVEMQTDVLLPTMGILAEDYTHIKVSQSIPRISGGEVLHTARGIIGIKKFTEKIKEDYFYGNDIQEGSKSELPYIEN